MHSEPLVASGTLPTFRRRVLRPFPCHGVFEIVSVLAECVSLLCCQKCFPILTQMILVRLRDRDLVLYLSTTADISFEMLPPCRTQCERRSTEPFVAAARKWGFSPWRLLRRKRRNATHEAITSIHRITDSARSLPSGDLLQPAP